MKSRQDIRKTMRLKRNSLSQTEQSNFSTLLSAKLQQRMLARQTNNIKIALYLASDGELNPQPFIDWCWQQHIEVYLPVLHPFSKGHLLFLRYLPDTNMVVNQYGILEPALNITNMCLLAELDFIFTPLVAFDRQGNRLGMGGGFYDRTLANTAKSTAVIGIAHTCQQVEQLPIESWDIPLPEIITPENHYIF